MNIEKRFIIAIALTAFVTVCTGISHAQNRQSDLSSLSVLQEQNESKELEGSWMVTVTLQGAPSFQALKTYNQGGTMMASAQGDVLLNAPPGVPPVATTAHGVWVKTGKQEFLATFRQIFYGADGSFQGGAKIRHTATLNDTGDQWSGQFNVEYFDAAGNVVFSGQGVMQATRIRPEPLDP